MKGTVRPLNELSLEDCVARLRIQSSDLRRLGVSIAKGVAIVCWSSVRIWVCTIKPTTPPTGRTPYAMVKEASGQGKGYREL
jgi:hypothetical protein